MPEKSNRRAVSRAQQRWAGACAHSDHPPSSCPDRETAREIARTPHKGLPERKGKR